MACVYIGSEGDDPPFKIGATGYPALVRCRQQRLKLLWHMEMSNRQEFRVEAWAHRILTDAGLNDPRPEWFKADLTVCVAAITKACMLADKGMPSVAKPKPRRKLGASRAGQPPRMFTDVERDLILRQRDLASTVCWASPLAYWVLILVRQGAQRPSGLVLVA